jgi:SAM-dependent methyltransferase
MEINLLDSLPQRNRDTKERLHTKTPERIALAKKFGWEYFDMKGVSYDGYIYDGRWLSVAKRFIEYYRLSSKSRVLDCGCAKGYLLYDFLQVEPQLKVFGVDISQYAADCSPPPVKPHIYVGRVPKFLRGVGDKQFDLVISINTIHNLKEQECREAVREIQRIGKKAFIMVDAYRNDDEKQRLSDWVLTAETVLHVDEWKKLFEEEGYVGDYFWWIP